MLTISLTGFLAFLQTSVFAVGYIASNNLFPEPLSNEEEKMYLEKMEKGDEEAKLDVIANAISYTHLLERQIEKENNVIYKFAQRELKDEILKEIDIECFKYEEENKDVKNKYIRIVESLEEKYR